jgi:hypothetical protein
LGTHINLIAGCLKSKPFWTDNFSQKNAKNYKHFANVQWMMKRIKKNGKSLTIAFCPSCISGEPWIIHNDKSCMMIHLAKENKTNKNDEPAVTAVTKPKNTKNGLAHPKEVTFY